MIAVVTGRGSGSACAACMLTSRVPGLARPAERRGESTLPRVLEFHAEGLDLRGGRTRDGQRRVRRMEHARQLRGLATFLGRKILDLDGDIVANLDAVVFPFVRVFDRQALDSEQLADQWRQIC